MKTELEVTTRKSLRFDELHTFSSNHEHDARIKKNEKKKNECKIETVMRKRIEIIFQIYQRTLFLFYDTHYQIKYIINRTQKCLLFKTKNTILN